MYGVVLMSNYPDSMDWGAYDDYHDPELECGHRANDGCDCWCEGGHGRTAHMIDHCDESNCTLYFCPHCGEEKEAEAEFCPPCLRIEEE